MRVSEYYNLGRNQGTLDFVDVRLDTDVPVFLNPRALDEHPSEWAQHCAHLVRDFFDYVLTLIKKGENAKAEELLSSLKEPNETRLGLSKDKPQGRAMGETSAHTVWHALANSEAAQSGLIKDLEDTVLLVHGIRTDIISDITTNIIRETLIEYTNYICGYYGIPLKEGVASGPLWDAEKKRWTQKFVNLPVPGEYGKLLLVPKSIVRLSVGYEASEYYRHYLLERMQAQEEKEGTGLVRLIKGGPRRGEYGATKTDLIEKYGQGKDAIVDQTFRFPNALEAYRAVKAEEPSLPLSHEQFPSDADDNTPDWDGLLGSVTELETGTNHATKYEDAIEALLSALLYPALTYPIKQDKLHDGMKRIDITYVNMGVAGFFDWLSKHYPSAKVMVECKNYGKDVGNPEVDQLLGRFSPSRGKVGLLVCRSVQNFDHLMQRCINAAKDGQGFIIPIVDDDLPTLIVDRTVFNAELNFPLLMSRFQKLIM